jgi:hypothetical protein
LTDALFDGNFTADERREFELLLRAGDEELQRSINAITLHADLHWIYFLDGENH